MQRGNYRAEDIGGRAGGRKVLALPDPNSTKAKARVQVGLSPAQSYVLAEVQRQIGLRSLEKGHTEQGHYEMSQSELLTLIDSIGQKLGFSLASIERDEVLVHIERDSRSFGILQELVDDPQTSDIIVTNFATIAVQQGRRNLSTDLSFASQEAYEHFVERLLQRAGSSYSTAKPIADGMIGDLARVHVVHRCLCESGPYLTIRLNRFASVSSNDLVKAGLAPQPIFDYLTAIIRSGLTVLVVGEVGTGKTTLVRALAASMPGHESVLVIEDTPEIRLEHPHVRYISTRESNTDGAGRVTPSECIRAGMRMAMNRIIFGEMRDAEAAESFIDVCASGHPGLSTIHARNSAEAVSRLELFLGRAQKGVSRQVIFEQIAKAVQVIVFVNVCQQTGKRRIFEIKEIGPVADGVIRHRDIFHYKPEGEIPSWRVVNRASAHREALEASNVHLPNLPAALELNFTDVYRDAAFRAVGRAG